MGSEAGSMPNPVADLFQNLQDLLKVVEDLNDENFKLAFNEPGENLRISAVKLIDHILHLRSRVKTLTKKNGNWLLKLHYIIANLIAKLKLPKKPEYTIVPYNLESLRKLVDFRLQTKSLGCQTDFKYDPTSRPQSVASKHQTSFRANSALSGHNMSTNRPMSSMRVCKLFSPKIQILV